MGAAMKHTTAKERTDAAMCRSMARRVPRGMSEDCAARMAMTREALMADVAKICADYRAGQAQ